MVLALDFQLPVGRPVQPVVVVRMSCMPYAAYAVCILSVYYILYTVYCILYTGYQYTILFTVYCIHTVTYCILYYTTIYCVMFTFVYWILGTVYVYCIVYCVFFYGIYGSYTVYILILFPYYVMLPIGLPCYYCHSGQIVVFISCSMIQL